MAEVSKEQLIEAAQALAKRRGQPFVLRTDFKQETGYGDHQVTKYWDTWTDFFEAAGLEPQVTKSVDAEDLLRAAHDVFMTNRGIPTSVRFYRLCKYSRKTYQRRWHTYPGFLSAFREWVATFDPAFPFLTQLSESSPEPTAPPESDNSEPSKVGKSWTAKTNRAYGSFLNFRGLQHAPINEQGVVFLFGMVAFELGYVVESIATGFPDCEAKRRTSISKDTWERVRIEFEYESRNFLDHGHKAEECDIIVCWNHNWQDCPIEVVELSSAIQDLGDDA